MKKSIIILSIIITALGLLQSCDNQEAVTDENKAHQESANAATEEANYIATGKELALQTKATLGTNLSEAIAKSGFEGALAFCNIEAIPLTDSMSKTSSSTIRRVSDKPRNPKNQAKDSELFYMNMYRDAQLEGKTLKPFLFENNNKMVGYYPIVTNSMCLNCHGTTDKDIKAATLAKINSLYPADQAVGYKDNELRGLFVVEMEK